MHAAKLYWAATFVLVMLSLLAASAPADARLKTVKGQTVYVSVYSHIYYGDRERDYFFLSATLSIRNTDMNNSMIVTAVDYYDTKGVLIEKRLTNPVTVQPLESIRFIVKESDMRGGSGAKFIVQWKADQPVNEPVVEAVMIGARRHQGISFTSRGQVISEQ